MDDNSAEAGHDTIMIFGPQPQVFLNAPMADILLSASHNTQKIQRGVSGARMFIPRGIGRMFRRPTLSCARQHWKDFFLSMYWMRFEKREPLLPGRYFYLRGSGNFLVFTYV